MGFFRFRRTFKIAPGIRLNVSKTGLSTSIGTRGATVNIRGDRIRETVGISGAGVSYSETPRSSGAGGVLLLVILVAVLVAIFL